MKKIFGFIILFTLFGCKKEEDIKTDIPENYYKNGIYVNVDSRMELLAVVQHFTTWAIEHHTTSRFTYIDDINRYFLSFQDHPAIKFSQSLTNNGFIFDAPPTYIMYLSEPPDLTQLVPFSDYLKDRAQGEQNLIDFTEKLRDFAAITKFDSFFTSHRNFYDKMLTVIFKTLGDNNYVNLIESFYGATKYKYVIIPTPLFSSSGYGFSINPGEGEIVYSVLGSKGAKNNIPDFGDMSDYRYLILHEFSHSFVNPVTAKYINEINSSQILFNPIKNQMDKLAYNNWSTCVNEHLVRINVIRMRVKVEGNSVKNSLIEQEKSQGFIYITQLDTLMQRYESDRLKYPTYEAFYPEITRLFNTLSAAK